MVAKKMDEALDPIMRAFVYLPFEHSEAMADQEMSVALFTKLGDEEGLKYAVSHYNIIKRFGRFPHRNQILNRESTPAEMDFLTQPGSSF